MAEYIERGVAIRELRDVYEREFPTADGAFDLFANRIVPRVIKSIPAAEVEPVRHTTFKDGECMACGWFGDCVDTPHYNYCPGCGARADGGAK